jgi:Tol biopolymer transport system component
MLSYTISPDSNRVVYAARQDTADVTELYSVAITGGAPVKLNGTLTMGSQVYMYNIQISPDSSRALYIANHESDGSYGLYSASVMGGTPTRLITTTTYGLLSPFFISPNASRVVCVGCHNGDSVNGIYSLPIGGGTPIKLNAAATPGDDVNGLRISPDSSRVVYRATQGLYSVPITGGTATKLSNPLTPGGTSLASDFQISPDNGRVIFRGMLRASDLNEVYSVPLLPGGIATVLNGTPLNGTDVMSFRLSPDSQTVVYVADQDTDEVFELYVAYQEVFRVYLPLIQR